jgi:hypothetical protein
MTNEELVRVGALGAALYNADDDKAEILGPKFEAEMLRCLDDPAASTLVMMLVKLLSGQPYGIVSNNPATAARVRSMAAHLGATVTETDAPWGLDSCALRVDPPKPEQNH